MKKLLAIMLSCLMVFSLAACGGGGSGIGGGSTKKADGGVMTDDTDNAFYDGFERLSGIAEIGAPEGYSVNEPNIMDNDDFQRIFFELDTENVPQEDIDKYAAAIWNLSIDVADDGLLYEYGSSKEVIKEKFSELSDAKSTNGDYEWDYSYNGKVIEIDIGIGHGGGNKYLALHVTVLAELEE